MRILWLSHLIPYPPKGGVLQRSYNLIKEVSRYHEVDLLAFNQEKLITPLFDSCEHGVKEARVELTKICKNVDFFSIPCLKTDVHQGLTALFSLFSQPYNINWLRSRAFGESLKEKIASDVYDLIHFDTISLLPYFKFIPEGVSTCLDHHNIESHMLLRRSKIEENFLKKFYFWQEGLRLQQFERKFCSKFSCNITCSDVDTDRLSIIAPGAKVVTVPNGVDLQYFKPQGLRKQTSRLIFVGTLNWYPNIEAVFYIAEELWPQLKKRYPGLHFDIIGVNPPERIVTLSKKYQDFHVHGFVDDVRPYIEAASIYVCPIHDGGGTKLKILDAMAMGSAIVAHPIACEGVNVSDGVNVLLASDPPSFVDKISRLLESPDMRSSLGLNARTLMETSYGFEAIGQQLSTIFQQSIG
jgi:polysaccharide biosynthesis protein PslH